MTEIQIERVNILFYNAKFIEMLYGNRVALLDEKVIIVSYFTTRQNQ